MAENALRNAGSSRWSPRIFVFLLATNWMKLLPGIESVGVMHCAEAGLSGYPAVRAGGAFQLYVDRPLYAGYSTATKPGTSMPARSSSITAMFMVLPQADINEAADRPVRCRSGTAA